jgi:hypothetical protein
MVIIGRLCASTHDAVINECVAPISNNILQDEIQLGTYQLSYLVFSGLLRPPDGLASHGCSASKHDCLLLAKVHSILLGHWGPAAVEPSSSDNASPNGPALHNGSILCLLLALGMLDCSIRCWGGKTRCLIILPLELTSSYLAVLAILLLMLRELPLELLLR